MSASQSAAQSTPLLLASRSPRRLLLLREAGFCPESIDSGIDDGGLVRGGVTIAQWTAALAMLKAQAALDHLANHNDSEEQKTLILAADTVVTHQHQLIGQPRNRTHAGAIIRDLRNATHVVISGVVLLKIAPNPGFTRKVIKSVIMFHDESIVRVGQISDKAIDAYLDTNQWKGKAGAYNLMERVEAGWPITWEGDPTTIMGLPMQRLTPVLNRLLADRR